MEMGCSPKQASAKIKLGHLGSNTDSTRQATVLSPQHRRDSGSRELWTARGPISCLSKLGGYLAQGHSGTPTAQLLRQPNRFCISLGTALAPLAFAGRLPLAIARSLELGDDGSLIELGDGAKHLPHQNRCRGILQEERRWGELGRRPGLSGSHALQDSEVAGEPVGAFNDDSAHRLAGDTLEHGSEPGARRDPESLLGHLFLWRN